MPPRFAQVPFADALPDLLPRERSGDLSTLKSRRQLAEAAGIDIGYLSRILSGDRPLTVSVCEKVASALELPLDYFMEVRVAHVADRLMKDPAQLNRLYRRYTGS